MGKSNKPKSQSGGRGHMTLFQIKMSPSLEAHLIFGAHASRRKTSFRLKVRFDTGAMAVR
jgi:hypothetical protein